MINHAEDFVAISRVLSTYAAALDLLELHRLDEVFTADARLEMRAGAPMTPAEYTQMCVVELGKLDATQHVVSNVIVDVDGDEARCRSYYVAQHARNDCDPPLATMGGWLDDALVRTDAGWRITHRRWNSVWFDGNPEVLGATMRIGAQRRRATHS
jgi:SnoaL-like domain